MTIRTRLARAFARCHGPAVQGQCSFFSLPLELRNEVYMYIFASSLVHEPSKEPLTDWDNLLLTCRQIKYEMERMPATPIIALVATVWTDNFPGTPLRIERIANSNSTYGTQFLTVAMPRAMFQASPRDHLLEYISMYISPLFRIFTEKLLITLYDDGSPLVNQLPDLVFTLDDIVWGRYRGLSTANNVGGAPCRNYFNANEVVVDWTGHANLMGGTALILPWMWGCYALLYCVLEPVKRSVGLRSFAIKITWVEGSKRRKFWIERVTWSSKSYFRRTRRGFWR
ncbi:hypothetical protein BU23DRAFT_298530 [Bimuria novae-zelandiae CBS 107.79]|uniref:Uncharacterized protein n=1 Tax=Bimuria novae-zelandiae CBS 107.79 TaxID=1447943 RepID=A0A6A5VJU7_9PLEO|nr:hypothetical protein BU23DRAFT_298530 [Bimuria novae-zelandiae CBS 107.79]